MKFQIVEKTLYQKSYKKLSKQYKNIQNDLELLEVVSLT